MNIAFVSNVVYPFITGGAEKRIYEIGSRLVDRGHEVTIFCRHYWDGPSELKYEGMTLKGVSPARNLYAGERRSITEAIGFAVDLLLPLRYQIDEYDLVDASAFPYFPVLSTRASTLFKTTPLVTTWHEVWLDYWDEYLGSLALGGKIVERVTARVSQQPVAVSEVTADRLSTIGPRREVIEVVPNGIDFKRIKSVSPAENGFDILFAGRLIREKNVHILLSAFDQIADHHNVSLGIIGEGPERTALQAEAQQGSNSHRITFLGRIDYGEVLAHMQAADLFVSPSVREGFGITFAEAMAADCTVIAAQHPNSAADEVLDDGGFLIEPTVESLIHVMNQSLSGERPPRAPMQVARKYDWNNVTNQAEQVYGKAATNSEWA